MSGESLTIEEYINAVEETMRYWLDLHTNPVKWAEEWSLDDIKYAFETSPVLSNNYFSFDWKEAALKRQAKEWQGLFNICKACGGINETGYDSCCDEPVEGRKLTIAELAEFLKDCETQPSEDALLESLEKDGFKVYRAALKDTTAPIEREVKDVLKSIRKARGKPSDMLQVITWANHVCHVNGNIIKDYGDRFGIDNKTVDSISQDGLASVFSQEEIDEYLTGE